MENLKIEFCEMQCFFSLFLNFLWIFEDRKSFLRLSEIGKIFSWMSTVLFYTEEIQFFDIFSMKRVSKFSPSGPAGLIAH